MRMHLRRYCFRRGASLVEVMLALLVLMVVTLGSANYRYLTALDLRNAREQLTGADLAVTLLGVWQGMGGSESYGPDNQLSSYLTISLATGDTPPDGYTLLGAYDVVIGGQTYRSTLCWRDVESDLRELGVVVSWPSGDSQQQKTFQLTGYAGT
jgi:Tfp pilus assembly protein PilV